jgi:hypothetical protein
VVDQIKSGKRQLNPDSLRRSGAAKIHTHIALRYSVILVAAITATKMRRLELTQHKSIPITEKENYSHVMCAGYDMSEASEKEWALKWVKGVVLGFARGRVDSARAFGVLRKAKKMGIRDEELSAIIQAIETNPTCLPAMTRQEKMAKLQPIKDAIMKGEI